MNGRHCATCTCEPSERGRYEFIVDGTRYPTNEENMSLGLIMSHVHYAHGRTVLWLRDGAEEEEVFDWQSNYYRWFSTVNTPRFLTVPPATY